VKEYANFPEEKQMRPGAFPVEIQGETLLEKTGTGRGSLWEGC